VAFGDDSKPAQHDVSFRNQDSERKKISSSKHTKEIFGFLIKRTFSRKIKCCTGDY